MEWARKPEKNALSNGGGQGAPRLKGYATVHRRRIVDLRGGFRRALATGDMRSGMCWETWGEGRVSGADDFDAEARRHGGRRGEAAGKSKAESADAPEISRLRSAAGATVEVW